MMETTDEATILGTPSHSEIETVSLPEIYSLNVKHAKGTAFKVVLVK